MRETSGVSSTSDILFLWIRDSLKVLIYKKKELATQRTSKATIVNDSALGEEAGWNNEHGAILKKIRA
jgi:hypothetical protein